MSQINKLLASLSWRQRISIVAAAILLGASVLAFSRWRRESDFKPLYTGLSQEDAAGIVQKLKETGTEYRLSETAGIVSVRAARVAELRLEMAAAGLPRTGRIGFELFDKTNFGATEFVEHVNYRRALEGELERSVVALAEVERARVHLTFARNSVFLESQQPAKASVMVKLHPGGSLSAQNVAAIANLVGSAVEGLAPEAVAVIDMQGRLLNRPRKDGDDDTSEGMLEYRRRVEKDLVAKISSTLEPLLGADKYRVGASIDCDFTSGEQSDETYDPAKTVMISSNKSEDTGATGTSAAGVPGTQSNLPRPPARPAANSQSGPSRRTENLTYQASRTVRKVKFPQGTVKRMSVSVLLDQTARWERDGKQMRLALIPPSPEMLKSVRDIVTGIAGIDPQRGDQLIIESVPFESTRNQEPPAPQSALPATRPTGGPADWRQDPRLLVAAAAAALVVLLAAFGGVMIGRRKRAARAGKVKVDGAPALRGPATADMAPGLPDASEQARQELESQLSDRKALQQRMDAEVLKSLKVPPVATKKADVLIKEIRENVKKDSTASAQVLRSWLEQRRS